MRKTDPQVSSLTYFLCLPGTQSYDHNPRCLQAEMNVTFVLYCVPKKPTSSYGLKMYGLHLLCLLGSGKQVSKGEVKTCGTDKWLPVALFCF